MYVSQISRERLQDHWSSGCLNTSKPFKCVYKGNLIRSMFAHF